MSASSTFERHCGVLLLIFIFLLSIIVTGQECFERPDTLARNIPDSITQNPEKFAKYLKENFNSDEKIVRALYVWLATNVNYDLDLIDSIETYQYKFNDIDLIKSTLLNKKGICENYAAIFSKICNLNGIPSHIVLGYSREFGKLDTKYGHAWNVAKIDSSWYLFDPTWGAGFVRFERFHKRFTFDYYKSNPDSFIKTHIPFDPIWQLKEFPISHLDFILNTTSKNVQMNFKDSIADYLQSSELQRLRSSFIRSEINGINQPELAKFYYRNKENLINYSNRYYYNQYIIAVDEFNNATNAYNKFVNDKNRGIKINNQNDLLIKINGMLEKSIDYLNHSSLGAIPQKEIDQLKNAILKLEKQVNSLKIKPKSK